MRILIVTPAKPGSRHGNRTTAMRWARLLRAGGHQVEVEMEARSDQAQRFDLMIALHARRSHSSILTWKSTSARPLVLVLTGTDVYRDIRTDGGAQASLSMADRLVVLQAEALRELPDRLAGKSQVIHQSVSSLRRLPEPRRYVLFTVIGHLREEKDPFRAALALRHLPLDSRIRVVQLGGAMSPDMARMAEAHAADHRYRWLGDKPHAEAMRWLARSRAMVISSHMEGGAHVVSEAIGAGVPVLASDIPGNIGLLGMDYPGYFPGGDTEALARLMRRTELDTQYRAQLERAIYDRRHIIDPAVEKAALCALVERVADSRVAKALAR